MFWIWFAGVLDGDGNFIFEPIPLVRKEYLNKLELNCTIEILEY
jgi:hypothetical protein